MININYWAVLAGAFASMIIGTLWYGPLFGKTWIRLSGFTKEQMGSAKKKGMANEYVMAFISSLLMSYVLANTIVITNRYLPTSDVLGALAIALWAWLGFVFPVTLSNVLWGGKSIKLWALESSYYLVTLSVISIIIALWV
jgi:hypothetical protein